MDLQKVLNEIVENAPDKRDCYMHAGKGLSAITRRMFAAFDAGNTPMSRRDVAPVQVAEEAELIGIPSVRFWGAFSASGRSVSTLVKGQWIGDRYRIYATAQIDGADFNLAALPSKLSARGAEPFEQTYMQALYDEGYRSGFQGYRWMKAPPRLAKKPTY